MSKIRANRIAEQLKKDLGAIIQREIKDPRVGFVTVTAAEVSGDLQQAKVYLTVMGDEDQKKQTMHTIEKAKGFIRSEVGSRIRLRHVPELSFILDESIKYGNRIEKLLKDINKEDRN